MKCAESALFECGCSDVNILIGSSVTLLLTRVVVLQFCSEVLLETVVALQAESTSSVVVLVAVKC